MGKEVAPRSLLELNVQSAIGEVLNKPRWWIKWQDPVIRTKWLQELRNGFLHETFHATLDQWHGHWDAVDIFEEVDHIVEAPTTAEKRRLLNAWLASPLRELNYGVPASDEENEEAEEEGDTNHTEAIEDQVAKREAYGELKWIFNQLVLREKLKAILYNEWTADDATRGIVTGARSLSDTSVSERTAKFVEAVMMQDRTQQEEQLGLAINDVEESDMLKKTLRLYGEKIGSEWMAVEMYITQYLEKIVEREQLVGQESEYDNKRVIITPGGPNGTWISDNLIDQELKQNFVKQVAELENVLDDQKDWHPHSNQQVLDLIHPSLYCCVFGKTMQITAPLDPDSYKNPAEQMNKILLTGHEIVKDHSGNTTDFQWIPTDFHVRDDGSIRILSYINNLHPEQYPTLYESIGNLFGQFVPLFERALASDCLPNEPAFRIPELYGEWEDNYYLPPRPQVPTVIQLPAPKKTVTLKGKTLQAIVKIAEIVLTPENPRYTGGVWHVEGTKAEDIVATGIYYFGVENIANSRLSFRVEVEEPPYHQSDDAGVAVMYGLYNEDLLVQGTGGLTTVEGRCIVFPNTYQHKVEPFELEDPLKPGVRKILAFFLVDPFHCIPSTTVIPPQQQEWIDKVQEPLLKQLVEVDSIQQNIQAMMRTGMTLNEAKMYRLKLMEERAASNEPDEERYFSLCEH